MKQYEELVRELITNPELREYSGGSKVWSHDFEIPLRTEDRHSEIFWKLPKKERSYRDKMPDYVIIYKGHKMELNYWQCESEGCCMSCFYGRCGTYSIKTITPCIDLNYFKVKSLENSGPRISFGIAILIMLIIVIILLILMSFIGNLIKP